MLQNCLCSEHTQTSLEKMTRMSNRPWTHGRRTPALKHVLDTDLQRRGRYSTASLMFARSFSTGNLATQNQKVGRESCLKEGCMLCWCLLFSGEIERIANACWAPVWPLWSPSNQHGEGSCSRNTCLCCCQTHLWAWVPRPKWLYSGATLAWLWSCWVNFPRCLC